MKSARHNVYTMANATQTLAATTRDRRLASQMKHGNMTAQYRPTPSNTPDESGSHKLTSMNNPYAAPRRRHTNGVAIRKRTPVRPFSVSYGARRSPAR